MKALLLKAPVVLGAALLVSACAGQLAHKGAVLDPQLTSSIQPGVDTKQVGVRNPRVRRQTTLLVRFDQAGNVASVSHTGKELVAGLDPANRKTPTLGRKRSFFDEIFGNIGSVGAIPTQQ